MASSSPEVEKFEAKCPLMSDASQLILAFLILVMGLLMLGTVTLALTRFVRSTQLRHKPRQHAIFPCDPWRESGRRLNARSKT